MRKHPKRIGTEQSGNELQRIHLKILDGPFRDARDLIACFRGFLRSVRLLCGRGLQGLLGGRGLMGGRLVLF